MTEWMSVKNRLPETKAHVHGPEDKKSGLLLLYSEKHGIAVGFLEEYEGENIDWIICGLGDNLLDKDVTHWMPLPEPPND
jgi:hypothetical protein